jgi:general stress protein 26
MNKAKVAGAADDTGEVLAILRRMVGKAKVAMLTTISGDQAEGQELRSRPLYTEEMDAEGAIWFIVDASTPKVGEVYGHGGKVCLSYVDIEHQNYLSLTGSARLVDDQDKKSRLWSTTAEIWFPKRKQDPSVSLLKIVPERGEYWDRPEGKVRNLFATTRALLTGNTDSFGENRKFEVER